MVSLLHCKKALKAPRPGGHHHGCGLTGFPEEIPELMKMINEGKLDLVSGWKKKRKDPIGKTLPSKFFNAVTRWASGIKLHDFNCGLKAYRHDVVKILKSMVKCIAISQ
jgi:hypothetical protein